MPGYFDGRAKASRVFGSAFLHLGRLSTFRLVALTVTGAKRG
jgi:hypothetical protein